MQFLTVASALFTGAAATISTNTMSCMCFPGDTCWPSEVDWAGLNATVGGRLIATVPLGSPCHDPTYNATECAYLQSQWLYSGIHMNSSSSVMAPFFANQSCDPWQPTSRPCSLGNYVRYSVNATGPDDIIAAVNFAREKNVRFVVRNTGHDYHGRSTGAGALSVWTHHLKNIEILSWNDTSYSGPAFKFGAGIQGFEALAAATDLGHVVVTGECPTVGIAGGYTQGGGHSGLSTKYGLAADNTLSFDVVTSSGDLVVASRSENTDLYWALSGGGVGYGVVVSITVKAHPEATVSGAKFSLQLSDNGNSTAKLYQAIDLFHESLPDIVQDGNMVIYFFTNTFLQIPALTSYNQTQAQLEATLSPLLTKLDGLRYNYTVTYTEYPTYYEHYDHYWGPLPDGNIQVGVAQFGGRLIEHQHLSNFSSTARAIAEEGVIFIGVGTDVGSFGGDNAVLPAWRNTIVQASLELSWNFTAPWSEGLAAQEKITDVVGPIIEAATPGSGTYMNEADWRQPDFQNVFYGSNYDKLLSIKNDWDPTNMFYSVIAVGSEAYTVQEDGRLCKA
ncbi:uncharacterized protein BCR38DRAFT_347635 [Pseudomassariella vexata]|uniref:FAD-binding PCMH-type domain-containing protein n=1 Tax=Pseudomassariella vexata TaxID=1141098 RepID=A0A1Y2DQA2_9PEZI|nr:uncharacterized protein BCR38DRAFT_347635 [Pseudomassariella vexata]ORY61468.1 hypothetical protein BCR38DRAFT_347635 [Pseudomassariella vexata]